MRITYMEEPVSFTMRRTVLSVVLALLGCNPFVAISSAQDSNGSQLILDTGKNRAPSEPQGVLTRGGPTVEQAKIFLQQRIQEQSQGRISLFGFRPISVKALDLEVNGKPACAIEFEAGIEFNGPCAWASRYRGRPLTFVALVELSNAPTIEDRHVFQVTAKGERFVFRGYALFTPEPGGWTPCGFGQSSRPVRESTVPDEASVQCINQLKLIGLAFRTWALDHEDRFPFNVSTNAGGTLECCVPGDNGFDANTAAHFQVMSNEVGTASTLVCPADTSKRAANGFQHLQAANVTYFVRSGKGVDETNPQEILVRCPIHGHVGLCDGSIKKGTNK